MKRLILIDTHAIIHRAFHALPPLTDPAGEVVNAVYGFASIFLKIIKDLKPDYVVAAFDHEGPTFRHIAYERYKAHREKGPDELYQQIPKVREFLAAFGVLSIEKQGYEADDIIGTVARLTRQSAPDTEVIIVTGDLDTLQLVDDKTKVFTMKKGVSDTVLYDEKAVMGRFGLLPHQLTDYKGLRGDPSDNIPGVKGVGEKTAAELLKNYESIENIYKALRRGDLQARPAVVGALEAHEADALFSRTLATIDCNVPLNFVLGAAKFRKRAAAQEKVKAMLEKFGFKSLLRRIEGESAEEVVAQEPQNLAPQKEVGVKVFESIGKIKPQGRVVIVGGEEKDKFFLVASPEMVYEITFHQSKVKRWQEWFERAEEVYVFDLKSLLGHGFLGGTEKIRDLLVMWWLLEPGRRSYDASDLAARLTGQAVEAPAGVAASLFNLAPELAKSLHDKELTGVYKELELPLVPILRRMELLGIGFNPQPLKALAVRISAELAGLEKKIYDAAGAEFNINSPRQIAQVLFDRLGLAAQGIRKTKKLGELSTRETELLKLREAHPVVGEILRFRELSKLKSTYVDALPKLVASDGRIHTTWNQTGTATGRLSSRNPNLQNIPIKSELGREIRRAFIADKGFKLVGFDYSQLELRIAADLAGDEKMIEAFRRGLDIHTLTAAEVNNLAMDKVTPELRRRAKTLNFGILYGMGTRALAEAADISRDEAEVFIERYFEDFTGITRFINDTKKFAHDHGYTKTAFGRKRFFPEISSSNFRLQRENERQAVNHTTQGTAADIMKKAMIGIDRSLEEKKLRDLARLLLQIHDELVFEIRESIAENLIPEIRTIMERVWQGKVSMAVEVSTGKTWAEL
ncbi:MAG: DNA polymerase I [Candidatus Sungbacteria bacterium]|nr:DNA polymerase I [Candidatus Sungbacteria bacterium]